MAHDTSRTVTLFDDQGRKSLLTNLTRLTHRRPDRSSWLRKAFRGRWLELAPVGLDVAIETGDPMGKILASLIDDEPGFEIAAALMARCDAQAHTMVPLREIAACSTRKVLDAYPAGWPEPNVEQRAELARLRVQLGIRLSHVGDHDAAVEATGRAVEAYRRLAIRQPESFLGLLGSSLNNLGSMLRDLGRREDAFATLQEAVGSYRELVAGRPEDFLPELASSLNNLCNCLGDLGRVEEALEVAREAVAIRRRLADASPGRFLHHLATSLDNLGIRLGTANRQQEAPAAAREAVAIRRRLAAEHPETYLPDLARSLHNLGFVLGQLGLWDDGRAVTREALDVYRQLAAARPGAFLPDLALSLHNLSSVLAELGCHEEALPMLREAITIRRRLAETRPDTIQPYLAASLGNLGELLSDLREYDEAHTVAEEALNTLAPFFHRHPAAFASRMKVVVDNYVRIAGNLGRDSNSDLVGALERELSHLLEAPRPATVTREFPPPVAGRLHSHNSDKS